MDDLILNLFDKECIKSGNFTLKNGQTSPIYIDLKNIISYPFLVNKLADMIWEQIKDIDFDVICGIPYGGIPIASIISSQRNIPMIMLRKERKKYGTNKQIEGMYKPNCKCLLLEDVITTGSSIHNAIHILEKCNIKIAHVTVICDRRNYNNQDVLYDYNISCLFSIFDIIMCLKNNNRISYESYSSIKNYFCVKDSKNYSFEARKTLTTNMLTKKILTLMEMKKTNLCFSADITDPVKLLKTIEQVGDHICILKLHSDIVTGFNEQLWRNIMKLAVSKKFFIFEDRKFCDIGSTFINQYCLGDNKISEWCDLITINCLSGEGIVKTFSSINKYKKKGCLLIHNMSTKPNLIDDNYKLNVMKYTDKYKKDIVGIITQKREINNNSILYLTPGVSIDAKKDKNDQNYRTPEEAIVRDNCDIIIVGRSIYNSDNPIKTVEIYKFLGWNAYQTKI